MHNLAFFMFKDKSLHGLFHKLRYVLLKCLGATRCLKRHGYGYCQVQFQLASSVQVQLRTEIYQKEEYYQTCKKNFFVLEPNFQKKECPDNFLEISLNQEL